MIDVEDHAANGRMAREAITGKATEICRLANAAKMKSIDATRRVVC